MHGVGPGSLLGGRYVAHRRLSVDGRSERWSATDTVLEREVALPYVKGLHLAGYSDEDIFYGNAFRRAVPLLISVSDRTLSSVVGSLICLEYAFRFPGSGALLVESVKLQSYAGIFVSALSLSLIVSVGVLLRDWILKLVQPE